MEAGSNRSAAPKGRHYRISVRGEVSQSFVEPLEHVFVQSSGVESILACQLVDQAELQAVLSWLYVHGVEIVSVVPDDHSADSEDPVTES